VSSRLSQHYQQSWSVSCQYYRPQIVCRLQTSLN